MNVLLLEDSGSASFYMSRAIRNAGYNVYDATSVLDARSYWEDVNIDCIVLDLNMDPEGLTPDEIDLTHGGLLTGWIWLSRYVLRNSPEMRRRCIIYTGFDSQLRSFVPEKELEGLRIVSKGSSSDLSAKILNELSDIKNILR